MITRPLAILLIVAALAAAQASRGPTIDPLHAGVIEAGISAGFGGGDVGGARIDLPSVITYRVVGRGGPAGQLHLGLGMWSRYQFVAEAAFIGGRRRIDDIGSGFTVESRANAVLYGASVHIRFPLSRRFVPFVAAGAGSAQSRTETLVLFKSPAVPTLTEATTQARLKEGSLAGIAGLGFQYFPSRARVGVRFSAKSYFPSGTSNTPFVVLTAGVFTWFR